MATRTLPAFLAPSGSTPLLGAAPQVLRGALDFIVRSQQLRADREIARVLRMRVEDLPALRDEIERRVSRRIG